MGIHQSSEQPDGMGGSSGGHRADYGLPGERQQPAADIPVSPTGSAPLQGLRGVMAGWWFPLAVGFVLVLLLARFDQAVDQIKLSKVLRGDVRRELEALQQFGQGTVSVLIGLVVLLLDPARRRWLLCWAVTAGVLMLTVTGLKMIVGRARPRLTDPYDPLLFLGPLGKYPWSGGKGGQPELLSPLEFWKKGVSDLWSMPSSHTAFAFLAAWVLSRMYPKLAPVVWGLAVTVGVCRLVFDAHYLTDVIAGACIAIAACRLIMPRFATGPRSAYLPPA